MCLHARGEPWSGSQKAHSSQAHSVLTSILQPPGTQETLLPTLIKIACYFFFARHFHTIPQARTLDKTEASLLKKAFLQGSNDNVRLQSQTQGFRMRQCLFIFFPPPICCSSNR